MTHPAQLPAAAPHSLLSQIEELQAPDRAEVCMKFLMARFSLFLLFVLSMWIVGCDGDAPPPPLLDPVASPTAAETVVISGSAEFGSKITMRGATFSPASVTADPYTARFIVTATLAKDTVNTLSFTSTDDNGNVSKPATLTIDQQVGYGIPATVKLDLYANADPMPVADPITLPAGSSLRAVASVTDAKGNPVDVPVTIATDIPNAFVAGDMIADITTAGKYQVVGYVQGKGVSGARAVTIEPGPAKKIQVSANPPISFAGQPVFITAIATDEYGNQLPATALTFDSSPALAPSYMPACGAMTFTQGFDILNGTFVAYDLSAGTDFAINVQDASKMVTGSTKIIIRPGPAARFAPVAAPADCTDNFVVQNPAAKAGEAVNYVYGVIDAYGNTTTGPVKVFTNAPGAQIIDDGVTGVGQVANAIIAGTYELSAYISGVPGVATRTYSIDVTDPKVVGVQLSTSLASKGDAVKAFVTVKDKYGNIFPCPANLSIMQIAANPAAASSGTLTCANGVFEQDFTFSTDATYAITATYNAMVLGSAYVTVLGIDATPPTVSILNLTVNGNPCNPVGTPSACVVAPNDLVAFDVTANDNVALSEVEYSAFFSTTQTLRTRNVIIPSNTPLPSTTSFFFRVPGGALPEDVALGALAIDGSGNRTTAIQVLLRVSLFAAGGRQVTVVASGGILQNPRDIAVNAAGTVYIANSGNGNLLQILAGSQNPSVFSNYNHNTQYLNIDSNGVLYATDASTRIYRVSANGQTVDNYVVLSGGAATGLASASSSFAKGLVDVLAINDGDALTVGTMSYQFDIAGGVTCTPSATLTCITTNAADTAAQRATLLATAISGGAVANANTFNARVVVSAKGAGAAGNAIAFTTTSAARLPIVGNATTLGSGRDEGLLAGSTGLTQRSFRFGLALAAGGSEAGASDMFNETFDQSGMALLNLSSATANNLNETYSYFVDNAATNRLTSIHHQDGVNTQVFHINGGNGNNFQALYDVVLTGAAAGNTNGCALVSDNGSGNIYAIDTRNPATTTPAVSLIASGFNSLRGLAMSPAGDLYVADSAMNLVVKISPANAGGCF